MEEPDAAYDTETSESILPPAYPTHEPTSGADIWAFVDSPDEHSDSDELPGYYPRRRTPSPIPADQLCVIHNARKPCAFLVTRKCWCKREKAVRNVACFKERWPGCGEPCGKPRQCGHFCSKPCHFGTCDDGVRCADCLKEEKARKAAEEAALEAERRAQEADEENEEDDDDDDEQAEPKEPTSSTAPIPDPMLPFPYAYSEYLLSYYFSNSRAALKAESALRKLILAGPNSSHHFPPCSRPHRKFLHHLAELYGLDSESFDPEPKRSVAVRYPDPLKKPRKKVVEDLGSDEEGLLGAVNGRCGVPSVGLAEAYKIWKGTGKLSRFPELIVEEEPAPTEDSTEPAPKNGDTQIDGNTNGHAEEANGDVPPPEEPAPKEKEKRRRKRPAANMVVEGPKPVAGKNVWDVLGEDDG